MEYSPDLGLHLVAKEGSMYVCIYMYVIYIYISKYIYIYIFKFILYRHEQKCGLNNRINVSQPSPVSVLVRPEDG